MSEAWTKFRAMWTRRPVMAETPPATATPDPSIPPAEIAAIHVRLDSLASRLDQPAPLPPPADGVPRSEFDAIRERLMSVEAWVARQADVQTADSAARDRLEAELAALRSTLDALSSAQRGLVDRLDESESTLRDLERTLESTASTLREAQSQLAEQASQRAREFNGRLAGLYVVAFVALSAALATLILTLVGTSQR